MKEQHEIKFWKNWFEADPLERLELVKKLSIVKLAFQINKLPKKYRQEAFVKYLNGFFEDLESAVYIKIRLEKKLKRKNE